MDGSDTDVHSLKQIRNIGSVIRNIEKAAAATQALGSG